eukprot:1358489-Rhodomonas_salina.1
MSWDAERVFCYCNLDCRQNSGAWLCYTSARSPTCCSIHPSMVRSSTSWKRAADPRVVVAVFWLLGHGSPRKRLGGAWQAGTSW